eukprot:TRINITY_DN91908_c0_g1_i1.p1 TRINITY_DN91908_c0_g1~~TRINITY_DN91908_c0_g1_i1.p1  ORF type:complete len:689 (+),score=130.56 TRINITY_DN91908_c0_g1_i1:100-2166(+)
MAEIKVAAAFSASSIVEIVDQLQNADTHDDGFVGFYLKDVSATEEDEEERLAGAVAAYKKSKEFGILFDNCFFTVNGWQKIWSAIAGNTRFINFLYRDPPPSRAAEVSAANWDLLFTKIFATHLRAATHLQHFGLLNVRLSALAGEELASAAYDREQLHRFYIAETEPIEVSTALVEKLAELAIKFPELQGFTEGSQAVDLNLKVISAQISNEQVDKQVQKLQEDLIEKASISVGEAEQVFGMLKPVCVTESERLLKLLVKTMSKYESIGGMQLVLASLPSSHDDYRGEMTQAVPAILESKACRVQWQLAVAKYKAATLQSLLGELEEAMAELRRIASMESQPMAERLTKFFEDKGMNTFGIDLPTVEVTGCIGAPRCNGTYKFHDMHAGNASFKHVAKDMFLYRTGVAWIFSSMLGKNGGCYDLRHQGSPRPSPFSEGVTWSHPQSRYNDVLSFNTEKKDRHLLKEAVLRFFQKLKATSFIELLTLKHELSKTHLGPPKSLARALEKGPEWLLDLNRFTIEVDSPAMMVLIYLLIVQLVEARGGRITRFDNYHCQKGLDEFKWMGGITNQQMDRPPCLHLNFAIDSWTYEGMIIFSDFLRAKGRLHKFYDIARAKTFIEALEPVFPVRNQFTPNLPKAGPTGLPAESKLVKSLRDEVEKSRPAPLTPAPPTSEQPSPPRPHGRIANK